MPDRDWLLSDFDFDLPEARIAALPATPRDAARLLHVAGERLEDHRVFDLPALLRPRDLLVVNDTKVIPARLFGFRGDVSVEILLNKPDRDCAVVWTALARPGKRLKAGHKIVFAPDLDAEIVDKNPDGQIRLRFSCAPREFLDRLKARGHVPLPPYIKRPDGDTPEDRQRYQTVYAAREGAVAAPTAGLHFTPELFARLREKDIERCAVTLHVGAGTFLPVKTERVAEHKMHAEWGEITQETADRINEAKKEGRRIVAVGTTSLRLLESAADTDGLVRPFMDETDIFITPGYRFRCVDALVTNFHLPKSTLFMLVCAFSGMDNMKKAYDHAVRENYRFYSYGDATLLEKQT